MGELVEFLKKIPMAQLAIAVSVIAAIGWVTVGGTVALVISMLAGGLIAFKAAGDNAE